MRKKERKPVIAFHKERCVNCHRCIAVCPVKMCNNGSGDAIDFNPALCIGCGECVHICGQQARVALDDFGAFLQTLKSGKAVVAIVAPSIAANFRGSYLRVNGLLKSLGVAAVFDVSFGAELTVKSYLDYMEKEKPLTTIAQPCTAIVNYIEIYQPALLKYLAPLDSPMLHTIKMIKSFYPQYADCAFAAISPCLAKRQEFDETETAVFNVTYLSVSNFLKRNRKRIEDYPQTPYENPQPERAVLFPSPGGFTRVIRRCDPDMRGLTRKVNGPAEVCQYLSHLADTVKKGNAPKYRFIDCLMCKNGCNGGSGTMNHNAYIDDLEEEIEKRSRAQRALYGTYGKPEKEDGAECLKLDKVLASYWQEGLYQRGYTDRSGELNKIIRRPTMTEMLRIYRKMRKYGRSDILNCGACGYNSCDQMAIAIYNGLNKYENCRHYMQIELQTTNETLERKVYERTEALSAQIAVARQAKREVDNAAQTKSNFLASISHELRTPMNAIIGIVDLMPTDNFTDTQKSYFDDMRRMSKSLLGIVNNLLLFSQPKTSNETGVIRVKATETVRALVVDDTPINLTVAFGYLARYGITAETAESGQEALNKISAAHAEGRPYEIVFMDHMMPEMDGVETTQRIRAWEASLKAQETESARPPYQRDTPPRDKAPTPIIALTANVVSGMKELFLESGMNDFLAKPIDQGELNRVLAEWLPPAKLVTGSEEPSPNSTAVNQSGGTSAAHLPAGLHDLLDIDAALNHVGGEEALMMYLRQFDKDFDSYVVDLRTALAAKDLTTYRIKVHALKGMFATMGKGDLAGWARTLENAARDGDIAACVTESEKALTEALKFRHELRRVLKRAQAASNLRAGGGSAPIPPALAKLSEGFQGASERFANLAALLQGATPSPPLVRNLLDKLYTAAFNSSLDGAIRAAEAFGDAPPTGLNAEAAEAWKTLWPKIKEALDDLELDSTARLVKTLRDQVKA